MTVNIGYSKDKEKVFITNKTEYVGSGICVYLEDIEEEDIIRLLKIKRMKNV